MVTDLPPLAIEYLPILEQEVERYWPECKIPEFLAAQVEQETCYSLTHRKCWNPHAELKTSREYGFGLGQLTKTKRFDNFVAAKHLDSSLGQWSWENRWNVNFQLRTLVIMNRRVFPRFKTSQDHLDQYAFMFAAYNGGLGGVLSDRRVCDATPGCDKTVWFGQVENTSKKRKKPKKGYAKSFFMINREYVINILKNRWWKYAKYFQALHKRR